MIKKAINISIISFILCSSGCIVYNPTAEFVKQRYTNTIAYFNTFYNAQRAFDEAEEEVLKARKEFNEKPSLGKAFVIPGTARTKFNSSIEKSSKLLSFYSNSKWVDDALLMIGESYYYLEDYVKAERKFLELITKYPESGYINKANLLLGVCYLKQKKTEQGIKQLEYVYSSTVKSDEDNAGRANYELAQHYFSQNNYPLAEKLYEQSISLIDDDEQKAFMQFQIGLCYENTGDYPNAEKSFAKVTEYSSEYSMYFNAELSRLKAVVRQKRYDEALASFDNMLNDAKNSDYYGSIHFEIANTLYLQDQVDAAIEKYRYIDTSFAKTDESAKSNFAMAQIYEVKFQNYDSARVFYNKAKSDYSASKITPEATIKSEIFNKYHELSRDLIRYDSLLIKAINLNIDDDSMAVSTTDSTLTVETDSVSLAEQKMRKATRPGKKNETKADSISHIDSTNIKLRLSKEIAKKNLIDSLHRSIERTKFEFAGLFFLEMQIPDSALFWYVEVIRNNAQSPLAPRALFSIAEIYRTLSPRPKETRDSIHHYIIDTYPASPYAQESRKILGVPLVAEKTDPATFLLLRAEGLADVNNYSDAIKVCDTLVKKYSNSPISPKAFYTMGWYLENPLSNNDSALAVYRKLIKLYPTTIYASAARTKVNEYDNEQKRIEDEKQKLIEEQKQKEEKEKKAAENSDEPAKQDSLSEPIIQDSLAVPNKQP